MARCSVCKEESDRLQKYGRSGVHFVICPDCLRYITYSSRPISNSFWSIFRSVRRWLSEIYQGLKNWFSQKRVVKIKLEQQEEQIKVKGMAMMRKAKNIPLNPSVALPQKR